MLLKNCTWSLGYLAKSVEDQSTEATCLAIPCIRWFVGLIIPNVGIFFMKHNAFEVFAQLNEEFKRTERNSSLRQKFQTSNT